MTQKENYSFTKTIPLDNTYGIFQIPAFFDSQKSAQLARAIQNTRRTDNPTCFNIVNELLETSSNLRLRNQFRKCAIRNDDFIFLPREDIIIDGCLCIRIPRHKTSADLLTKLYVDLKQTQVFMLWRFDRTYARFMKQLERAIAAYHARTEINDQYVNSQLG